VDAGEALAEATRLSTEIDQAAILDRTDGVLAATAGADTERLRRTADDLLEVAGSIRPDAGVERVEVTTRDGAVYAVRSGERVAIATTREPAVGALVVHDLRSCLARLDAPATAARRKRKKVVDA